MRAIPVIRLASLLALGAASLSACGTSHEASIPPPKLASFLPTNFRVTSVLKVNLDGSGLPEEAITAVGPVSVQPGFATSTVLLIAWDELAKRWTVSFDALHQPSWQASSQLGKGPGLVNLTNQGPRIAVVHDQPHGKSDLLYWLNSIGGNTSVVMVGIVHFQDQIANLAYSYSGEDGHVFGFDVPPKNSSTVVKVIGKTPHQEVEVTQPWLSAADSESDAVRMYSIEIAPISTDFNVNFDQYHIVKDDMPYVGVGLNLHSTVVYVYQASPAFGELRVGDIITGVEESPLPLSIAEGLNGPSVIDAVELFRPGDVIFLKILRDGTPIVIHLRLAQWPLDLVSPFQNNLGQYMSMM
jgi:hypothetical protein